MGNAAVARFLKELRRRRVFRVAGLYVVAVWLLMQAANILFPAWGIPDAAISYLLWAGLLGFPVALAFGWVFDISAQGIRRTQPVGSEEELLRSLPLRRADYAILTAFLVVVAAIVYDTTGRVMDTATYEEWRPSPVEIEPHSVAVLPFADLSAERDQEYFTDGISEEILNRLAAFRELKVIARTSSFVFKDSGYDIGRISGLLAVNYLLQGSVRRDGERLRIAAQLVDRQGVQVWASSFDRELGGVFQLQDEIAEAVATSIVPQIVPPPADDRLPDIDAYEHYLVAREIVYRRDFFQFERALEHLNQALEIDPDFAEAYVERAIVLTLTFDWPEDQAAAEEQAAKDVDRALLLKSGLARAHAARAYMLLSPAQDSGEVESAMHKALALDPNMVDARVWLSNSYYFIQGRFAEAEAQLELASRIDPLSPRVNTNLADLFERRRGDAEAAERRLRRLLDLPQPSPVAWFRLWQLYAATGRLGDALELAWQWQRQAAEGGDDARPSMTLASTFAGLGMWEAAEFWQARAERASPLLAVRIGRADLLIAQGRHEEALSEVRKAIQAHGFTEDAVPPVARPAHFLSRTLTGAYQEAIAFFESDDRAHFVLVEPFKNVPPHWVIRLAWLYQEINSAERADTLLRNMQPGFQRALDAGLLHGSDALFLFAAYGLVSGDNDAAIDRLQQAFDAGWRDIYPMSSDPLWDPLRDDPRFQAILAAARSDVAAQRMEVERNLDISMTDTTQ